MGKKTYASFIIFKELQDALINHSKEKTAFPKCHCASLQLYAKSDISVPYVITSLLSPSPQWQREER